MALVVKDRVRETSTTAGTGTFTLAGAVTGYQSFAAVGDGNTTYYTIYLQGGNEWEVGIGAYTASGTTLSRDTILASSNAGSAVNFSAGVKDVFVTYPAGRSVWYDSATNVTLNALTLSGGTANGVPYLSSPGKVLTTGSALTFDGVNFNVVRAAATDQYMSLYADGTGPTLKFFGGAAGKIAGIIADSASASMYFTNDGNKPFVYAINGSEVMRLTSTGLKASIAGTNADPVFSYTSGTNTGIFFPAADKLGFTAGGGSDQMVLTTTGLGIGTSSPGARLQVTSAVSGSYGAIIYNTHATGQGLTVRGGSTSSQDAFNVQTYDGGTSLLSVQAGGNVGIGTSSPTGYLANKLVVATGTDSNNGITIASASNRNGSIWFADGTTGNQSYRGGVDYQHTTDTLYLYSGAQGNFQLDSSGNLGLGVTPSAWGSAYRSLDMRTNGAGFAASDDAAIVSVNAYNNSGWKFKGASIYRSSRYDQFDGTHAWHIGNTGTADTAITFTQAMTLDALGNLLVGGITNTSMATVQITVGSTSTASSALQLLSTTSGSNGIYFGDGTSSTDRYRGYFEYNHASDFMVFATAATERARITSGGTFQTSLDASIYGVTVGRGGGAVATNTAVGASALAANTTGANNTATGNQALVSNRTGDSNSAFGYFALRGNTTGTVNTAVALGALQQNTTGAANTAIGTQALTSNTTASNNTAVGYQALYASTPPVVTAGAFVVSTSYTIVTVGTTDFVAIGASANTVGVVFTATGAGSGTGTASTNVNAFNTAIGYGSGSAITTGTKHSILGAYTGNQGGLDIRTASNYCVISDGDGNPRGIFDNNGNFLVGTTSGSNRLTVSSTANDYISRMYNTNATGADMLYMQSTADPNDTVYKTIYALSNATARFYVQSNGGIGNYQANNVNLSDLREKTNFAPAKSYLDTICAIPVQTFNYIDQNMEKDGGLTLGVVAQDVQAVAPELVMESNWGTEDNPKIRLSIYQTDLQYALMKCIQELKSELDSVKAELAALKGA